MRQSDVYSTSQEFLVLFFFSLRREERHNGRFFHYYLLSLLRSKFESPKKILVLVRNIFWKGKEGIAPVQTFVFLNKMQPITVKCLSLSFSCTSSMELRFQCCNSDVFSFMQRFLFFRLKATKEGKNMEKIKKSTNFSLFYKALAKPLLKCDS